MTTVRIPFPEPSILAGSLVSRVQAALDERPSPQPLESDLPGGDVAFAAGHLYLLANEAARRDLDATLWPRLRRWLATPAVLVTGSYRVPAGEAQRIVEANVTRMAAGYAGSVTGQEMIRTLPPPVVLPRRAEPAAARRPPGKTASPAPAESVRRMEFHRAEEAVAMLHSRLEAGFLLAACEALWPSRAESMTRVLWHDAGLRKWDEWLTLPGNTLQPLAPPTRRLLAATAAALDEARFGPLLAIARSDGTGEQQQMHAEGLDPATGTLLAERLVRLEHGDHHAAGRYLVWQDGERVFVDLWEPDLRLELMRSVELGVAVARLAERKPASRRGTRRRRACSQDDDLKC